MLERSNSKLRTIVVAAVIWQNNRFLICQRPEDKSHGGLWEFPGGKQEIGESAFQAIQRELFEELRLKVLVVGKKLLTIEEADKNYSLDFYPVVVEGEPKLQEHKAMFWADEDELGQYNLAPGDYIFSKYLLGLNLFKKYGKN